MSPLEWTGLAIGPRLCQSDCGQSKSVLHQLNRSLFRATEIVAMCLSRPTTTLVSVDVSEGGAQIGRL